MSRRNQPYIPLYVQDFMTDEKLRECKAESIGVYIFIMCLMHKSEHYGKILLKQKDKQSDKQIINFAHKVAKHLPFSNTVICYAIDDLVEEGVLQIEGDFLIQKRMVKDNDISIKRSSAGSKGGKKTKEKDKFAKDFAQAKLQANSEYEYENEIEDENSDLVIKKTKNKILEIPTKEEFLEYAKSKLGDTFAVYNKSISLKYDSWQENNWHTGGEKPRPIKNWKTTLLNTLPHLKEVKESSKGGAMEALLKKHNIQNG